MSLRSESDVYQNSGCWVRQSWCLLTPLVRYLPRLLNETTLRSCAYPWHYRHRVRPMYMRESRGVINITWVVIGLLYYFRIPIVRRPQFLASFLSLLTKESPPTLRRYLNAHLTAVFLLRSKLDQTRKSRNIAISLGNYNNIIDKLISFLNLLFSYYRLHIYIHTQVTYRLYTELFHMI